MIYAAKEGWYKEEPNMNTLQPHDMLRISTILESWGELSAAEEWIGAQKSRLYNLIQERLDYKMSEIEEYYEEDLKIKTEKLNKARQTVTEKKRRYQKPTKSEERNLEMAQNNLDKLLKEKETRIQVENEQAESERGAICAVEKELLEMLQSPELRKRYFSVVDMAELEENEFNLNIPRYVDTFEPEEEIDLKEAIEDFKKLQLLEKNADKMLTQFLKF